MNVVLDTNVVASAIMTGGGVPAQVFRAWLSGQFDLLLSAAVLLEIADVLHRPHIRARMALSDEELEELLGSLRGNARWLDNIPEVPVLIADPKDTKFLALAKAAGAHAIVSGDAHLLDLGTYEGIPVLTPAQFLDVLEQERG